MPKKDRGGWAMRDESTEASEKIEASDTSREHVDQKGLPPGLGESLVHDDAFYSGGGPRLIVDVKGMLRAVEDEERVLWVNPGRSEFRTAPSELSGAERAGTVIEAGWRPARLIKVERVVEASEDLDIVDLTIEVYSRLETYRIEDASGYFASEDDEVGEIDEIGEIEQVDEIEDDSIVDVAALKKALAVPEGLSYEDVLVTEAAEKIETQLVGELEALDHQELWDFYQIFVRASHAAMRKKKLRNCFTTTAKTG
jgi:hypothetical protein